MLQEQINLNKNSSSKTKNKKCFNMLIIDHLLVGIISTIVYVLYTASTKTEDSYSVCTENEFLKEKR